MRPLRFQLTLLTLTVLTMFVSAALDWGPLVLLSFVSIPALLFVLVVTIFAVQPAQGARRYLARRRLHPLRREPPQHEGVDRVARLRRRRHRWPDRRPVRPVLGLRCEQAHAGERGRGDARQTRTEGPAHAGCECSPS